MKPKTRTREERIFTVDLEIRAATEDQPLRILGHPIIYDRWSEDLGGFRERVRPGSMTKTLAESDIRALFNHDPNIVMGRTKSQTLSLVDEPDRIRMELFPPDTTTIRDLVVAPMERRDITQMSFSFKTIRDEWRDPTQAIRKDGLWERDLLEARLYDVSVVTFPAYTHTDAAVRDTIGFLDGTGIDFSALTALLTRAERGISLTDADIDLLNGSIDVLRSYIPEPEPQAAATPEEPKAGRSIVHLARLVDLRERELSLTA